ncbi:MAG TPA: T9SS type A sorting domain-containing protein [Flavipsychrobacter sp.]|nr:T9SS type A sorting domain-containing protein [Flavipsychrobacter sp.]
MRYFLSSICFIAALFFTITLSHAQPGINWKKCYGTAKYESFAGIVNAHGAGYVFAGYPDSCINNSDYQIVKIDDTGKVLWSHCYGGANTETPRSIIKVIGDPPSNNGYLISGTSGSNDGDVSGNHGGGDFWVIKTDTNGNLQWQKCLGGTSVDEAFSATQTNDKNLVIAGVTQSNNGDVSGFNGGKDWWVVKLDQNGGILWKKTLGGSAIEMGPTVAATNDGGVVIAGEATSSNGDITSAIGLKDIWVVKLDASGNKQWDKSFGSWQDDWGFSITQTKDTGYIISAKTTNYPSTGINTALIKISKTGQQQWAKGFNILYNILELPNGYIATGGNIVGTALDLSVYRLDDTGKILWQKVMGGSNTDLGKTILSSSDGGYIIGGHTNSTDGDVTGNNGDNDYWIIKLAPDPLGVQSVAPVRNISVYPNPTTTEVRFSEKVNIKLLNLLGQQLEKKHQVEQLDLSPYPVGIYILTITDDHGNLLKQEKLVKE